MCGVSERIKSSGWISVGGLFRLCYSATVPCVASALVRRTGSQQCRSGELLVGESGLQSGSVDEQFRLIATGSVVLATSRRRRRLSVVGRFWGWADANTGRPSGGNGDS